MLFAKSTDPDRAIDGEAKIPSLISAPFLATGDTIS
jgi:hypothetical protein